MRFAKASLLIVFFNPVIICHAQTGITGSYVSVLSDTNSLTIR